MEVFMRDRVDKLYTDKDIVAMLALKAQYYLHFKENLQDLQYLATVDKEFIHDNYKDLLETDEFLSLEGCSVDQVRAYFEMKHRAVKEHLEEQEEAKQPETASGHIGVIMSSLESIRHKQEAALALTGGLMGITNYIQGF